MLKKLKLWMWMLKNTNVGKYNAEIHARKTSNNHDFCIKHIIT